MICLYYFVCCDFIMDEIYCKSPVLIGNFGALSGCRGFPVDDAYFGFIPLHYAAALANVHEHNLVLL